MALPPFGKDHSARIVALEQTVKEQARAIAELIAQTLAIAEQVRDLARVAVAEKKTRQKNEASNA